MPAAPRGFLYSGGTHTELDYPPSVLNNGTLPQGINSSGPTVGSFANIGLLYSGGTYTGLSDPSITAMVTDAFGINDAGLLTPG
jgi:hypothetical protein